jgi:hypothetical protein
VVLYLRGKEGSSPLVLSLAKAHEQDLIIDACVVELKYVFMAAELKLATGHYQK